MEVLWKYILALVVVEVGGGVFMEGFPVRETFKI